MRTAIKSDKNLHLYCNIIEESVVGNTKMPVLKYLRRSLTGFINGTINHVTWLRCKLRFFILFRFNVEVERGSNHSQKKCYGCMASSVLRKMLSLTISSTLGVLVLVCTVIL